MLLIHLQSKFKCCNLPKNQYWNGVSEKLFNLTRSRIKSELNRMRKLYRECRHCLQRNRIEQKNKGEKVSWAQRVSALRLNNYHCAV